MSIQEKYNLPSQIKVLIHKSKDGFTAVLPDYPGCVTHANGISELVENINDVLLTYFEVPRKEAEKAEFLYAPCAPKTSSILVNKLKRVRQLSEFVSITPPFVYA